MRQSLKTCVFVVTAASGVLGAGGGVAYADAGAGGGAKNSPGVLSGNSIQVTVDTPVNACGNSVDGGAALNPATGASCGTVRYPERRPAGP
ncbi:chaplin [Streptomyces lydicus]|nr:chaplin [Streptomyces lydicus]